MDRNRGEVGRTDSVVWVGRQRENSRLVGLGDGVIDGPERDRDGGPAGANGSITAKHSVIHPVRCSAADRVKNSQLSSRIAGASDAESADVSGWHFGGI